MHPVFLTRVRFLGQTLSVASEGIYVWPAFTLIKKASEIVEAQKAILRQTPVFFSSPSAVIAVAKGFTGEAIGPFYTVGRVSAEAIKTAFPKATVIYPDVATAQSGHEALIERLEALGYPKEILLVGATDAPFAVKEKLIAKGVKVDTAGVYDRKPLELTQKMREELDLLIKKEPPVVLFTSRNAVDAFLEAIDVVQGAREWFIIGRAFAIHENIARHLVKIGFREVELAGDEAEMLRAIGATKRSPSEKQ